MTIPKLHPTKDYILDQERIAALKSLFPEAIADGAINFNTLSELLGAETEQVEEHFGLNWPGKQQARRIAGIPSKGALVPLPGQGVNEDTTRNVFIEGDNLEVLKLLQKSYASQVKMIYIDPPYNTGNDFIYKDDFKEPTKSYLERTGQTGAEGELLTTNPKSGGRFHSNWLNMMYPRLRLARNLLREDGVIFVSIDDNEAANLRLVMDEVFGEENFRNAFITRRYDKNLNRQFMEQGLKTFNIGYEYIICYAKSDGFLFYPIFKSSSEERMSFGYWKGFWNDADRPTMRYELLGVTPKEGQWKWSKERAIEAANNYILYQEKHASEMTLEEYWENTGKKLSFIRRNPNGQGKNKGVDSWIAPSEGILRSTNWTDLLASKEEKSVAGLFDSPKNVNVIKNLITGCCDENSIILDFFAGSSTTAHAVLELNREDSGNRKFICVQLPEPPDSKSEATKAGYKTIAEVSKERIRRVIKQMQSKDVGQLPNMETRDNPEDLGFKVYQLTHSNFKPWQDYRGTNMTELQAAFDQFETPLIDNWQEANLLTEVMLSQGFSLDSRISPLPGFTANTIQAVESDFYQHRLVVCLDPKLSDSTIAALTLNHNDIFVCLDSALTDQAKMRLTDHCNLRVI